MIAAGMAGGAGLAKWLGLAASPTFAAMAILTSLGSGPMVLCSAVAGFPLGGMVPMYLLMSVFHAGPWLKLIADRSESR
jgi:poly(3-hydroxybutyrate) depolymerase